MNLNSWNFPNNIPKPFSKDLKQIIGAAIQAVDPASAVIRHVGFQDGKLQINGKPVLDCKPDARFRVAAFGKAALEMVYGLDQVLGEQITGGIVVTKHAAVSCDLPGDRFSIYYGNHPVPGEKSVEAARAVVAFLNACNKDDVFIFLISGGGSSLLCLPEEPLTLKDLQAVTSALLASGATIQEMNIIRKHLDKVKGGKLAAVVTGMPLVSLVISDVVDNSLSSIASGPTVPDASTFLDVEAIVSRYALWEKIPVAVRRFILDGMSGKSPETIQDGHPTFAKAAAAIIASNHDAMSAAKAKAESFGFKVMMDDKPFTGEASSLGEKLVRKARKMQQAALDSGIPACVIFGGESTVTIHGTGKGGRNLEVALGAISALAETTDETLVTLATDGEDGPTDAAGACVTSSTLRDSEARNLDVLRALRNNNSYEFAQNAGLLIKTGPTGTNVNDLVFWFYTP